MKYSTVILPYLAVLASAGRIAPRQLQGLLKGLAEGNDGSKPQPGSVADYVSKGFGATMKSLIDRSPEVPLVSRTVMEPQISKEAKRYKLRYGPLTVDAANAPKGWRVIPSLDPNGQGFLRVFEPHTICKEDCTVLGGRIYVENVDGSKADRASGVYDHHTLTMDVTKQGYNPVSLCDYDHVDKSKLSSWKSMSSGFIGSSEDNSGTPTLYTSADGTTIKSGYHLKKDNKIVLQADFVNYSSEKQNVFIAFEIESIPGLQGWDAATTLMSVTGCKFEAPLVSKTERSVQKSKQFPILIDGAVLGAKGHMHNGGEKMVLMINDKQVCESKVEYEGQNIAGMKHCSVDYLVKRGDTISIEAVYDVTKHPLRPSADGGHEAAHSSMGGEDLMSMWGLTFAVDVNATQAS